MGRPLSCWLYRSDRSLRSGVLAKSNAGLVEKAVRIAREFARDIATPDEAGHMLVTSEM